MRRKLSRTMTSGGDPSPPLQIVARPWHVPGWPCTAWGALRSLVIRPSVQSRCSHPLSPLMLPPASLLRASMASRLAQWPRPRNGSSYENSHGRWYGAASHLHRGHAWGRREVEGRELKISTGQEVTGAVAQPGAINLTSSPNTGLISAIISLAFLSPPTNRQHRAWSLKWITL